MRFGPAVGPRGLLVLAKVELMPVTTLERVRLRNRVRTRLKQARIDADLSQSETAQAVGLPQALISRAETGGRELKAIDLYCLAQLFGRSLESFFLDDEENGPPIRDPAATDAAGAPGAGPEPGVPPAPSRPGSRRRGGRLR